MRAACTACLVIALAMRAPIAIAHDAGATPSSTVRWERPPEGTMERGALGVPAWVVVSSGTLVVLGSALALGLAARRSRRGARR